MKPVIIRNEPGLTIKAHEVVYDKGAMICIESCGVRGCQEISLHQDEVADLITYLIGTEALRDRIPHLLAELHRTEAVRDMPLGELDKVTSNTVRAEPDDENGSGPRMDMGGRMPVVAPLGWGSAREQRRNT